MWYKQVVAAKAFGGGLRFPLADPATNNQILSPYEAKSQREKTRERALRVPLERLTIQQKLELLGGHTEGEFAIPTPQALTITAKEPPAAIPDDHETTNTSGDATDGGGNWGEYKRENPMVGEEW